MSNLTQNFVLDKMPVADVSQQHRLQCHHLQREIRHQEITGSRFTRCRYCDGRRLVIVLPGRAHGTGRQGCVDVTCAGQESLTPQTHCTCVGGPLWSRLQALPFGRECRLDQTGAPEYNKGRVVFWVPASEEEGAGWMEMPAREWRNLLRAQWEHIVAGETLEEIAGHAG